MAGAGLVPVLTILATLLFPSSSPSGLSPSGAAAADLWSAGPLRWLLLPSERRELERVRTERELAAFAADFWRRRDPIPESEENPFATRFFTRVRQADQLYSENGTRGSLTDRGRALVLLGPPSGIRSRYRAATRPSLTADRAESLLPVQDVPISIWVYQRRDLDPPLAARLADEGMENLDPVSLRFVALGESMRLVEGQRVLRFAVEEAVLRD